MKPNWWVKELIYALIIFNGSMEFGYILVYPSPAIENMKDSGYNISKFEEKAFKSISALTAIFGPFLSDLLLRYMGRRPVSSIFGLLGTLFWLILPIMKKSFFWFGILERGLIGIMMGAYSAICPLYIVELSPPNCKGFFGTLNQLGIAIGIVICYLIGNWVNWRLLAYCGAIFTSIYGIFVWFCPESNAGLELERARKESKSTVGIESELISVQKETLFQKKYAMDLIVGCALMFFQQFCGINGILTNITKLFKDAGLSIGEGIASAISSSAQVFSIFVGGLIIDHTGRRLSMIISVSGLIAALLLYALSIKFKFGSWFPILAIFIYLLLYGIGMGPIPWFIVPELFPTSVRSIATSIASSVNWLCAFIVIFIFPLLEESFGEFTTMLIFMFIMVGALIFSLICVHDPRKHSYNSQPLLESEPTQSEQ